MMRKRAFMWGMVALSGTLLLSSCSLIGGNRSSDGSRGGAASGQDGKSAPIQLTIRHTQVKDTQKKRLAMLQDVVAAGNPPEIFDLFGGTDTRDYVKANRLLDLTPILQELGLTDKFYSFEEFTVGGKIYGIPMAGYVEGLYYNKKMLANHEIQPPQTWDELMAAAAKLKSLKITPFALAAKDSWVINMMINTMWVRTAGQGAIGGLLDGSKKWTDPDMLQAFEQYQTLIQKGYFQDGSLALAYAEQQNAFISGGAAFMFDGSWANTPLLDPEKSSIVNDVGFMSLPSMGGPGDGYINGGWSNAYGFSKKVTPDQLMAIKEFIRQMYNEPMQRRQLLEEGMPPAMKLSDTGQINPLISQILQVFETSKGTFPAFDSVIQTKVRESLERSMQELIGGRTNPAALTADLQRKQEAANAEESHTKS